MNNISDLLSAANAYQKSSALPGVSSGGVEGIAGAAATSGAGASASFSGMVSDYLDRTVSTLNRAETSSVKAMQGEVSIANLVTSVAEAESSLRTIVAIRDRMISAYQDIIKMPI